MKKIIINTTVFVLIISLFSNCEKYLDINQNPNAATTPPISGLLANTTYNTAYNVYRASDYTSYYTQYLASPNAGSATDTYDNVNASGTWNSFYDALTDLYDMKRFASQSGLNAYIAVADVLTALHLNMASNLWGDVPYSEAFVGVENVTPKFDNQQAVFDTAMSLLSQALTAFQQPGLEEQLPAASDFIHGGDINAWIKTTHALRARMLNQLSQTPQYNAAAVIAEVNSAYQSNADDAQVSSFAVRNPWAQVAINNAGLDLDGWLSTYFVNTENGNYYGVFDPRLPLIASITKFNDYRGTPNGAGRVGTGTAKEESYIAVDGWYSGTNSPLEIITYAEMQFVKAEAAFRSGDKSTAYTSYLQGITANMQKMLVADTAIQRYTSDPAIAVGEANITLPLIMKEKYVACFLNPVTWDDMRRLDYQYPNFALPANAVLSTFIRRMNYPTDEIATNGANVPEVTDLSAPLWWDQ